MINERRFQVRKDGKPKSICYCTRPELIENYDEAIADKENMWECHHRLEFMPFSGKEVSFERLKELGLYFNVEPEALIFLTVAEHNTLHKKGKKIKGSWKKGNVPWNKGKKFKKEI